VSEGRPIVLLRGGGDLATGVAARLHRCGFGAVVTEIAQPLAVRRLVALAEAVYAGHVQIEDLHGQLVKDAQAAREIIKRGDIPVLIDPTAESRKSLNPVALIDARMRKEPPEVGLGLAPFVVGLGPGFTTGLDCHAVVETNRGHNLGRVYWFGQAEADTRTPGVVAGLSTDRVLRAPVSGKINSLMELGSLVREGQVIAMVGRTPLRAPFDGALRGLVHNGLLVNRGMKVGDLDPRGKVAYCHKISDKALAVAGGVIEALLSQPSIRCSLGSNDAH
jgi:xanthine dehydrogenase accessory factor